MPSARNATHELEQLGRDASDRSQLVDGRQRDLAAADHRLRTLGQFEQAHPRGHACLGPAECLGGSVLGQPVGEHRLDRLGLLVGAQLLAGDVLQAAVDVGVRVGLDFGADLRAAELLVSGEAVKARDELVTVAVGADDHRDAQAP